MKTEYSLSKDRVKQLTHKELTAEEEIIIYKWYLETYYAQDACIQELRLACAKKLGM